MNIIDLKIEGVDEEISISLSCYHNIYTLWAMAKNDSLTFKLADEEKILQYLNTFFNCTFERIGNSYVNTFGIEKTSGYKANITDKLQTILSNHFKTFL